MAKTRRKTGLDRRRFFGMAGHAKRLRGEAGAIDAVAAMMKTQVVPLNEQKS